MLLQRVAGDREAMQTCFGMDSIQQRVKIEDFVNDYNLVARFKAMYEDRVEPIPDRPQWLVVNLGFKVHPPLLGREAGRPKVQR